MDLKRTFDDKKVVKEIYSSDCLKRYSLFFVGVFLPAVINFDNTEPVIVALSGVVIYGIGTGFVFKTGYTTGGVGVLKQIVSKYGKMTLGQATVYIEGFVIICCLFVFGWQAFIYSILSLFVINFFTDKVILGI